MDLSISVSILSASNEVAALAPVLEEIILNGTLEDAVENEVGFFVSIQEPVSEGPEDELLVLADTSFGIIQTNESVSLRATVEGFCVLDCFSYLIGRN